MDLYEELKVQLLRDCEEFQKPENINFEIICIGGGSIRGFCELGALYYLENNNIYDMKHIHTLIGSSVGSIISLLLCIGYKPFEILEKVNKIESWMDFDAFDLINFKNDRGLFDFKNLIKILEDLIILKLGKIPTLEELYKITRKKLIIVTTNVYKKESVYLDYINNPTLLCTDAIQMSCSIPLIFKKFIYNGEYYVDGGLLDNFPLEYVNNGTTKIIGISVESSIRKEDSFINYIDTLFTMPILKIQNNALNYITDNCLVINIKANNTAPINFNLTKNTKIEMFCDGYRTAKAHFE